MCDHSAETNRYSDPGQSAVRCPAVEQVAQTGIDEAEAKCPQTSLRLFDSSVATREEYDNGICENACKVAEDAADEGREEHQTGGRGGEVVGFVGHDYGDCLVVSE